MKLEAQAKEERLAIQELKVRAADPITLPTPEAILRRAQDLDRVYSADPVTLREKLRRVFVGGRILLHPQADGTYLAEGTMLPMIVLAETTKSPTENRGFRVVQRSVARGGFEPPTFGL